MFSAAIRILRSPLTTFTKSFQMRLPLAVCRSFLKCLLLLAVLPTGSPAGYGQFVDMTAPLGLNYSFGDTPIYQDGITLFNGGFSLVDFDQDGWDDLSFGSAVGDTLYLYRNVQGSFEALPSGSLFPAETDHSSTLHWIDYDNDGDKDLYVANDEAVNHLYRNDGGMSFTDVTVSSGIWHDTTFTYSVAWGDYDRDGWLDCYIVNRDLRSLFQGQSLNSPNALFHNNGDGTFTDVTLEAGVADESGLGFVATFADYDNDHWPDLFIANDKDTCNKLYRNNGNGTFTDVSEENSTGRCISAMGIATGDYDHNGYLDFYVTNGPGGNLMLQNQGDGTFTDHADSLGLFVGHNGWGTIMEDFDNDGDEDLFAVNGGTSINHWLRNPLWLNQGDGSFIEDTTNPITVDSFHTFGASLGDWNNDGFYDIAVMNTGGDPAQLWQHAGGDHHWIKLELEGVLSNRDGIGTWVEVWANGQRHIRYSMCGNSFASQYSDRYIIGLGAAEVVDSLRLSWPSGVINNYFELPVDQLHLLVEDTLNTNVNCSQLYYLDFDGDGYGTPFVSAQAGCFAPAGMVANNLDCDDLDPDHNPDTPEVCDGYDNNCNDEVDEELDQYTFYQDLDEDGFGDPTEVLTTCEDSPPPGYVSNNEDCNDEEATANPTGTEVPNNDIDEDCDGEVLIVGTSTTRPQLSVRLFPNPVQDILQVSYPNGRELELWIHLTDGRVALQRALPIRGEKVALDLRHLPAGIYILSVIDRESGATYQTKIVR